MKMQNVPPEEQQKIITQFYNDLIIDGYGCNLQLGKLDYVELLPKDSKEALVYIENQPNENLYFLGGVHTNREKQRARDKDVILKNHFFFDFDLRAKSPIGSTDEEIKELGCWIGEKFSKHSLFGQWRYIAFSGNGIHVHYFGDPARIVSIKNWKEGIQHCILLAESHVGLTIDSQCANVARLCRAPGSYNNKNGGHRKVEILLTQPDAKMDIGYISKLGEQRKSDSGASYQKAEKIGDEISQTSRNATLTSLAGSMRYRGIDEATILTALREVNTARCKPPLEEKELVKISRSIGKYDSKYESSKMQQIESNNDWSVFIKPLSEYEAEDVEWLWKPRIAIGFLTLIEGDPDVGKSTLTQAIACAVTLGEPLPADDEKHDPARVLMLVSEEGIPQIVLPKLERMGADISMIDILESVKNVEDSERMFSLAKDIELLEPALEKGDYRLLIIDPLNSYMGGKTDMNSESDVRGVLDPFLRLAQKYEIAVVCIRHFGKGKRDKTMQRAMGSTAYTAVARAAYAVEKNPMNTSERIMAKSKNNLAQDDVPAIAFEITGFGQFEWKGERNISLEELFSAPEGQDEESRSLLDEAIDFLRCKLAKKPMHAKDVIKAAKGEGIKERTLRRAREEVCETHRDSGDGCSVWTLKSEEALEDDWTSWTSADEGLAEAKNDEMTNMTNTNERVSLDEPNDSTDMM